MNAAAIRAERRSWSSSMVRPSSRPGSRCGRFRCRVSQRWPVSGEYNEEGKDHSALTSLTPTTTYRVKTFQEGDWWVAWVAGLDANYTQARTFEEVRDMARDLIALALDIDEAEVGQIVVTENDWR